MRFYFCAIGAMLALSMAACSSISIRTVDFGWPVEEVTTVSPANTITAIRYGLSFNVGKIAQKELQDSTALRGTQLRVIRSNEGYYFVTGPRFKHVYVFNPLEAELSLESIIEVSKTGLNQPALNLRAPYVQLSEAGSPSKLLSRKSIVEGNGK